MSRSPELYQWRTEIAKHFPHLSQPMVMGLALWSLGMILVRSCSLTAIADWWSCQLGQPFQTVRERLRDTYRDAEAKAGGHRAELDLRGCWAPWLAWVLEGWSGTTLALALDATTGSPGCARRTARAGRPWCGWRLRPRPNVARCRKRFAGAGAWFDSPGFQG